MKLETTLKFPNSISCVNDVLGKEFEVKINGVNGILATPQIPKKWRETNKTYELDKPLNASDVDSPTQSIFQKNDKWGIIMKRSEGYSIVDACQLTFELKNDSGIEKAHKLSRAIRENLTHWVSQFHSAVELLTHQNVKISEDGGQDFHHPLFMVIEEGEHLNAVPAEIRDVPEINVNKDKLLDLKQIKKSLTVASQILKPSTPHELLRNARIAFRNENYRARRFECATITEIVLVDACNEKIDQIEMTDEIINYIEDSGLYGKIMLARSFGVIDGSEADDLHKKRKDVIHEGDKPEKEQVKDTLSTTIDVVERLVPNVFEENE